MQKGRPGIFAKYLSRFSEATNNLVKPSTVVLKELEEKAWAGACSVQRLTNPKDRLDRKLKGIAKSKDDGSVLEFEVNATLIGILEFVNPCRIADSGFSNCRKSDEFELSVEFQSSVADVSPFVVPMTIVTVGR